MSTLANTYLTLNVYRFPFGVRRAMSFSHSTQSSAWSSVGLSPFKSFQMQSSHDFLGLPRAFPPSIAKVYILPLHRVKPPQAATSQWDLQLCQTTIHLDSPTTVLISATEPRNGSANTLTATRQRQSRQDSHHSTVTASRLLLQLSLGYQMQCLGHYGIQWPLMCAVLAWFWGITILHHLWDVEVFHLPAFDSFSLHVFTHSQNWRLNRIWWHFFSDIDLNFHHR